MGAGFIFKVCFLQIFVTKLIQDRLFSGIPLFYITYGNVC